MVWGSYIAMAGVTSELVESLVHPGAQQHVSIWWPGNENSLVHLLVSVSVCCFGPEQVVYSGFTKACLIQIKKQLPAAVGKKVDESAETGLNSKYPIKPKKGAERG